MIQLPAYTHVTAAENCKLQQCELLPKAVVAVHGTGSRGLVIADFLTVGLRFRSTVFDRLAPEARSREESARSLAAARKSVFDRLRGM